jgi:hypothetical protein
MESWELEKSVESKEMVNSPVIILEDTSEGENDSDDWPVHE